MRDDTRSDETGVLIVRDDGGRFATGTRAGRQITAENATEYRRKRQQKAQARTRTRVLELTRERLQIPLNTSADVVAEAAAMLWTQVVLNPDAYPRDRLDAFLKIGQLMDVIPAGGQADGGQADDDTRALAGLAREQIIAFVDGQRARRRQADDGHQVDDDDGRQADDGRQ